MLREAVHPAPRLSGSASFREAGRSPAPASSHGDSHLGRRHRDRVRPARVGPAADRGRPCIVPTGPWTRRSPARPRRPVHRSSGCAQPRPRGQHRHAALRGSTREIEDLDVLRQRRRWRRDGGRAVVAAPCSPRTPRREQACRCRRLVMWEPRRSSSTPRVSGRPRRTTAAGRAARRRRPRRRARAVHADRRRAESRPSPGCGRSPYWALGAEARATLAYDAAVMGVRRATALARRDRRADPGAGRGAGPDWLRDSRGARRRREIPGAASRSSRARPTTSPPVLAAAVGGAH